MLAKLFLFSFELLLLLACLESAGSSVVLAWMLTIVLFLHAATGRMAIQRKAGRRR